MNRIISISGRAIGEGHQPYIIAELSANHNGSIETAFKIIKMAKKCGSDAIKIQTYHPNTITLKSERPDFKITDGLWAGRTLYDLYEEAYTPWEWHEPLFEYARKVGITIFSSPFDNTAVDLLENLNTPAYKIASFEAIDIPLIKYVASTKKPMIISTGMANLEEICEAVAAARDGGCEQLSLLHCVSGYPAPAADYNLRTISDMIDRFDLVVGLSDHTIDNATAIASISMGASLIEKHVTLDRKGGGPDDSFSLESKELEELCRDTNTAWHALGKINYDRKSSELSNIKFRRSLYFVKDLRAGDTITPEVIRSVRPGYGAPPKYYDRIIGMRVLNDVCAHTPVVMENLS